MAVGEYVIVMEDDQGNVLATTERITLAGRPTIGEEVEIGDEIYKVHRVLHEDDKARATKSQYTTPRIFVRLSGRAGRNGKPKREPSTQGATILRFQRSPGGDTGGGDAAIVRPHSLILPASLAAVLVACGWRSRADALAAARRRISPESVRPADRVTLEKVAAKLDADLREAEARYSAALTTIAAVSDSASRTLVFFAPSPTESPAPLLPASPQSAAAASSKPAG